MARASKSKPAPGEPLSGERIVEAAFLVIEREGLAGFSMRKLAAELGCEAMSIYHYFPGKGHLMDALADRAISEIPPLPPKDVPWNERVREACRDYRACLTKRPNFFMFLATFRMNTPTCLAYLDGIIGLFGEVGLSRGDATRLFRVFSYYVSGTGLDEAAGYAHGPSTVEPVPDEVMARDYPNVVAAGPYFRPSEYDRTFEMGMDLLLESVGRLIKSNSAPGGPTGNRKQREART